MQPNTRVFFNVQFNSVVTSPVTVVVPGYGSVVITPVTSNGAPTNGACPYVALQSNQYATFQLTGTSPIYHDTVIAQILNVPTVGHLYQYDGGVKGPVVQNGDLVTDIGNRLIYDPEDITFGGSVTFTYKLVDQCQQCSQPATCSISVTAISVPPPTTDFTNPLNTSLNTPSAPTSLNGTSYDGSPLVAIVTTFPTQGGTLTDAHTNETLTPENPSPTNSENEIVYIPPPNQNGDPNNDFLLESFTYVVRSTSTSLQSREQVVNTRVTGSNAPTYSGPAAAYKVNEDSYYYTTLTVTAPTNLPTDTNYTINFQTLLYGTLSTCANISCAFAVPSSVKITGSSYNFYYLATVHVAVIDQLIFTITGSLDTSSPYKISYNVSLVNQAPQLSQTTYTFDADMDSNATIQLTGATDRDTPNNVSYVISYWNGTGNLYLNNGAVVTKGSPTPILVPGGQLTYLLTGSYGQTSFKIQAKDPQGLLSNNISTVFINVARVNYPAIANSLSVQVKENYTSVLTLSGSDINTDDHPLTFTICTPPSKGTLTQIAGGAITSNSQIDTVTFSGTLSSAQLNYYIPFPFYGNQIDYFSFQVSDQHGSTSACVNVSIDVNTTHVAPVATNPGPVPVDEDTPIDITLTGYDLNGESLTYWIVSTPQNAVLTQVDTQQVIDTTSGAVQVNGDTVQFKGDLNWNGDTSFVFNVRTAYYTSTNSETVDVTVNPVNDAPVATSDSYNFDEETDFAFTLSGTDVDSTVFTYTIETLPVNGTLKSCTTSSCTSTQDVTANDVFNTPYFTYNGGSLYYGTTSFDWFMTDDQGAPSDLATVTFVVNRVDHAPESYNSFINVTYPSNGTVFQLLATDVDTDLSSVQAIVLNNDFIGSLYQYDDSAPNNLGAQITSSETTVLDSDRRLVYVPVMNTNIDKTVAVTNIKYWLWDQEKYSTPATIAVYVNNANMPPVPSPRTATGIEDEVIVIQFSATDTDSDGIIYAFTITQLPTKGTLYQFDNSTIINTINTVVTDAQFRVIYKANPYGYGNNYDRFYYSVTNNYDGLTSDPVSIDITISHVNHQPIATINVEPTVDENGAVTFELTGYDPDGDTLVASIYQAPIHGVFYQVDEAGNTTNVTVTDIVTNSNYLVTYKPTLYYHGVDTFQYIVTDSAGSASFSLSVAITVNFVNQPPFATSSSSTIPNNATSTLITLPFGDVDNTMLNITLLTQPSNGKLSYINSLNIIPLNGASTFLTDSKSLYYAPNSYGTYGDPFDYFSYTVSDGEYSTSVVNQTIIVQLVNSIVVPRAPALAITVEEDSETIIYWNATDIDGPFNQIVFQFPAQTMPTHGYFFDVNSPNSGDAIISLPYTFSTPSSASAGWPMKFMTSVQDYYSPAGTYETVLYTVRDQYNFYLPSPLSVQLTITPVNDPPVVSMVSNFFTVNSGTFTYISGINVSDVDAGNGLLSVNITSDTLICQKIELRSVTNLFNFTNTTNQILFDATLSSINAAFAQYLVYHAKTNGSGGFVTVTVNDNGNYGSGGAKKGTSTLTVFGLPPLATKPSNSANLSGPSITGAVVGGTAALSSGLYGVYAYMKKRKLLPEDTDPWEADADFDKTLENPLYSGTPSTTSAASVTLVTSDT